MLISQSHHALNGYPVVKKYEGDNDQYSIIFYDKPQPLGGYHQQLAIMVVSRADLLRIHYEIEATLLIEEAGAKESLQDTTDPDGDFPDIPPHTDDDAPEEV